MVLQANRRVRDDDLGLDRQDVELAVAAIGESCQNLLLRRRGRRIALDPRRREALPVVDEPREGGGVRRAVGPPAAVGVAGDFERRQLQRGEREAARQQAAVDEADEPLGDERQVRIGQQIDHRVDHDVTALTDVVGRAEQDRRVAEAQQRARMIEPDRRRVDLVGRQARFGRRVGDVEQALDVDAVRRPVDRRFQRPARSGARERQRFVGGLDFDAVDVGRAQRRYAVGLVAPGFHVVAIADVGEQHDQHDQDIVDDPAS